MKLTGSLLIGISTVVSAAPHYKPYHGPSKTESTTTFGIGQNYLNEWSDFAGGVKTPAGISVYGNIYDGVLLPEADELLQDYAGSNSGYVEIGLSWKDDMLSHGYSQFQGGILCADIANGKFDDQLNMLATYLAGFPDVQFLLRPDYEVSGNIHANTDPNAFDPNTWDLDAYPNAFKHVRDVLTQTVSNIQFIYHPVRGSAETLYPGDDVVDYQGFSIFNNDVCLTVGNTPNCEGDEVDPNVLLDIQFATKPKWIAESAPQPPASDTTDTFLDYLTRVKNLIETYDFAGWTYINSDWTAHGWPADTWGDTRIEANPDVLAWFNENIVGNPRYVFA